MSLADKINAQLEAVEKMEEEIEADIDKIMDAMDIDAIIQSPEGELVGFAMDIKELIQEKYEKRAIMLGVNFSKELAK